MFRSKLTNQKRRQVRSYQLRERRTSAGRRRRILMEPLEARLVLAAFYPRDLTDTVDGTTSPNQ